MKRVALQLRDRRALTAGACLILPALLYTLAARPYVNALSEANDRLRTERALLSRELALLSAEQRRSGDLAASGRAIKQLDLRSFPAGDATAAAGALAAYVAERATVANVAVLQIETRDGEDAGAGLTTIGVAIRAEGDLEGILTMLRSLETGARVAWVEELVVERGTTESDVSNDTETLKMSAVIKGFVVANASSDSHAPTLERHGAP